MLIVSSSDSDSDSVSSSVSMISCGDIISLQVDVSIKFDKNLFHLIVIELTSLFLLCKAAAVKCRGPCPSTSNTS